MHLTFHETGRLTLKTFNKLYGHYKDDWDMEMLLTSARMTYAQIRRKSQESEEWF